MKRRSIILAVAALLSAGAVWSRMPHRMCDGFLPKNKLNIAVNAWDAKGLTHEQFDAVLDRIQAVYGPILASKGATLEIERRWEDGTVNASASREGDRWQLHMYGGLARHEKITQDGFTLVACHELGHHLGGAPKAHIILLPTWASNEGESDYYSTLKCARRMFVDPGSKSFTRLTEASPIAAAACDKAFANGSKEDKALCVRSAMAGLSLASLLRAMDGESREPDFNTPDQHKRILFTNDNHPAAQCRLDTLYQGAQCTQSLSAELDDHDYTSGTCTQAKGFQIGLRPRCWYVAPPGQLIAQSPATLPDLSKPGTAFSQLANADLWKGQ